MEEDSQPPDRNVQDFLREIELRILRRKAMRDENKSLNDNRAPPSLPTYPTEDENEEDEYEDIADDDKDSDDDESDDEDNLETEKGVERPKRRKGCPLNVKANCIRYNKDRNQNIL